MIINQLFDMKLVACNQLFHTVPVPQEEAVPRGVMPYRYKKLSQTVPLFLGWDRWDSGTAEVAFLVASDCKNRCF